MGSEDGTLTCAPGSVGSVAESMATTYSRLKSDHPHLSKMQLLVKTLTSWDPDIGDASAKRMAKRAGYRLEYLVLQVLWEVHADYRKAFTSDRLRYAEMLDTVREMSEAHAPGA